MASHLPDWQVSSATLAQPGALDAVLTGIEGAPFVYPLFMTDGWFVRSALPKRLGDAPAHILPPFGGEAGLPALVVETLNLELEARGWTASDTHLLVASHGSGRSPRSRQATEAFVEQLRAATDFAEIQTGYIEEVPFFGKVAMNCPDQALCLPFFAALGGHVKEDVADALSAAAFTGPCLAPIGTFDRIPAFIAESLRKAARSQVAA